MISRKDAGIRTLLSSQYISTSTISAVLGCGHQKAKEAFSYLKEKELEKVPKIRGKPLDVRPFRIPSRLFMKEFGIDYGLTQKQFDARIKYEEKK